jgi:hypothetical protein
MSRMRWQDWVTLVAGIWLLVSPMVFNYAGAGPATWNAVVLGIAVIILSIIELSAPRVWEELLMVALGVWLLLSPWLLVFGSNTAAAWNAVVAGIVVGGLALWATSQRGRGGGAIANF